MDEFEQRARFCELEARIYRLEGRLQKLQAASSERHSLYIVKDELEDRIVYVGITNDYASRAKQHHTDPSSAVWAYINEHGGEGYENNVVFTEVASFPTRAEARRAEEVLIGTIPGLSNRDVDQTRRRLASVMRIEPAKFRPRKTA